LSHEVRHGAATIRDVDFRRPAFELRGENKQAGPEADYEHYDYRPGGFLIEPGQGGDTPFADDRGIARHDDKFGKDRAARALIALRGGREAMTLGTNVLDLKPGTVFAASGHTHPEIDGRALLSTGLTIQGVTGEECFLTVHPPPTYVPFPPPAVSRRPPVSRVQTAVLVGPRGDDDIHTDEFGRVRVQFPWDREGIHDDKSGPWIRVAEGWGGRGYGMITIPRMGQEVLVSFLEGDPDRPIIVGRVENQTHPVPETLPENKTQSDYKSDSSPKADGFNRIRYEDKAGEEEVYIQAQRNQRALVKNDETITVGHDRQKNVSHHETDTTDHDRFEVTEHDRRVNTGNDHITQIKNDRRKLVKNDEKEVVIVDQQLLVEKDKDIVGKGNRREKIYGDSHLHVLGKRNEKIQGTQSL
ncbi:MAG: type VI secretion system tip protein VgrG, partial [Phycisphaerales bacterium]|nr:type VI secretion system tip protein VgrG [Phycisphaerales bacterium]